MGKRVLKVLLAAALLVGVGIVFLWGTAPRPRIDEEAYKLIREGMHESEIVSILGAEAGDYSTRAFFLWHGGMDSRRHRPDATIWSSDDAQIFVWFDENRLVSDTLIAHPYLIVPKDETIIQKCRRWLRL